MSEPSSQSIAPIGGFIGQICAYFRDFLDTDFRKQRMPKRNIGMRDAKGNLTGISIAKYPELTSDLWRQLGKQLDAIGGDAANLELSNRRADAVKQALATRYHVDPAKLTTAGFGATKPKESNDTAEGRARNRRVELARQ